MRRSSIFLSTFALAVCVLGVCAWHGDGAGANAPPPGDPTKGKKIFSVKCVACHRPDGRGGIKVTGPATPNFRDPKLMALPAHSDSAMRECITHGRIKSGMVAWSKQGVKPADIENLIAYIRTFSAPKDSAQR